LDTLNTLNTLYTCNINSPTCLSQRLPRGKYFKPSSDKKQFMGNVIIEGNEGKRHQFRSFFDKDIGIKADFQKQLKANVSNFNYFII